MSRLRPTRTARRLALSLLGALAVLGVTALGVLAAGGKPDFSISLSPASQTVTLPSSGTTSTTFSVAIARQNGFSGPVAVSVAGLPVGVTAAWSAGGTIAASQSSGVLTLTASAAAKPGSYGFTVTGVNGQLGHAVAGTLVIQPLTQPSLALTAQPASQTVLQGDAAAYDLVLTRSGGFTGAVTLSSSALPAGVTGSFSRTTIPAGETTARLTVDAGAKAAPGGSSFTITAAAGTLKASAAVALTVQQTEQFRIGGAFPAARVAPGAAAVPLDVQVTNPNNFAIVLQRLNVTVEEQTSRAGCSGSANYRTTALSRPVTVPARTADAPLSSLQVPRSAWPALSMLNRAGVNQDACKGAVLSLAYDGTATK